MDTVSLLQVNAAKLRVAPPVYTTDATRGPPHAPQFSIAVSVAGIKVVGGFGTSKQTAKALAARAALEQLGWIPPSNAVPAPALTPAQPAEQLPPAPPPLPQTLTQLQSQNNTQIPNVDDANRDRERAPSNPANPISMLNTAMDSTATISPTAISQLFELAMAHRVQVTDMYHTTGTGAFVCYFMWGATRQLPTSDPQPKKKDAKAQAAMKALVDLASSGITPPSASPRTTRHHAFPQPSLSATSMSPPPPPPSAFPIPSTNDLPQQQQQQPPLAQPTSDPHQSLILFLKSNSFPSLPTFTELSNPSGFQFTVSIDHRVIATSDVFTKKPAAKRHAAELALELIQKEFNEPATTQTCKKQRLASTSASSDAESVLDVWERDVRRFCEGIAETKEMRKCCLNVVASVCLALSRLGDRVVVSGVFGRGTGVVCEASGGVELVVLRIKTRGIADGVVGASSSGGGGDSGNSEIDRDGVSKSGDGFEGLVRDALQSVGSIQRVVGCVGKRGVEAWYNGIQSLRIRILEGWTYDGGAVDSSLGQEFGAAGVRLKQIMQETWALTKVKEAVSASPADKTLSWNEMEEWTPTFSELTQLFFRNHAGAAHIARFLKFWVIPLNLESIEYDRLCNILDYVAVWAFDNMDRSVNYDATRHSLLFSIEQAFKLLLGWKTMRVFWTEFYTRSEIHSSRFVASAPPFLLDPTNPYLNLVESVRKETWECVGFHAETTKRKLFDEFSEEGTDFINLAVKPVVKEAIDVEYFGVSSVIVQAKDQFSFTVPDFQIYDPTTTDPAAEPPYPRNTDQDSTMMDMDVSTGGVNDTKAATITALEKIKRLANAHFLFASFKQYEGVAAGVIQHADVTRMVETCVVGVQGGVRVNGGVGNGKPNDCLVGTILWPVVGKFAVNFRMDVKG
ncbi:hypothetical protein HDU79_008897 [Rhizoclosmatium sp. JEL0117]|nr:hypothetical protein HDU79_008897 [Rhizoclosmatium sp. JEL0117]